MTQTITAAHAASYGTYGARRVHAELRLGSGVRVGRKRVERLMRAGQLQGVHRRRLRGCTRRDQAAVPSEDLVQRRFTVDAPNRLWCADVTQHRTGQGWLYLAVVLDCFPAGSSAGRWAITCAPSSSSTPWEMALWQRRPGPGTIHHADHGAPYTSWAFGHRLREAGLLASMGSVGDALDNSVAESFFATLQTELLDRSSWSTRTDLASAIFFRRRLLQPAPPALHLRLSQPGQLRNGRR